jgi:hypothetical protein
MNSIPQPRLVKPRDAAKELGVSESWLAHDRIANRHIPFHRIGDGLIRYDMTAVHAKLAAIQAEVDAHDAKKAVAA